MLASGYGGEVSIYKFIRIIYFNEKFERLVMSGSRFYEISDVKQKRCLNEVSLAFVVNNEIKSREEREV